MEAAVCQGCGLPILSKPFPGSKVFFSVHSKYEMYCLNQNINSYHLFDIFKTWGATYYN